MVWFWCFAPVRPNREQPREPSTRFAGVGVRVFGAVLNEVASTTVEESHYMQYYYSYHPKERTGGWKKLAQALHK
jgi:hypothetical protein